MVEDEIRNIENPALQPFTNNQRHSQMEAVREIISKGMGVRINKF